MVEVDLAGLESLKESLGFLVAAELYVAFFFNAMNRVADALGFEHRSDRDRRRGAQMLRRRGYRVPAFLLR
jgi:hypothetical protein